MTHKPKRRKPFYQYPRFFINSGDTDFSKRDFFYWRRDKGSKTVEVYYKDGRVIGGHHYTNNQINFYFNAGNWIALPHSEVVLLF